MACCVHVTGGEVPQEEVNAYLSRAVDLYGREPDALDLRVDGDYVDIAYHYADQPFHRIRRLQATSSARSTASTTPNAPRSATASSILSPFDSFAAENAAFSFHI